MCLQASLYLHYQRFDNYFLLTNKQCIHMYICTLNRLEEEDRHMGVDYAWPTKLVKLANYELLFQTGLLWHARLF